MEKIPSPKVGKETKKKFTKVKISEQSPIVEMGKKKESLFRREKAYADAFKLREHAEKNRANDSEYKKLMAESERLYNLADERYEKSVKLEKKNDELIAETKRKIGELSKPNIHPDTQLELLTEQTIRENEIENLTKYLHERENMNLMDLAQEELAKVKEREAAKAQEKQRLLQEAMDAAQPPVEEKFPLELSNARQHIKRELIDSGREKIKAREENVEETEGTTETTRDTPPKKSFWQRAQSWASSFKKTIYEAAGYPIIIPEDSDSGDENSAENN